jgi:hypothetical protein
LLDNADAVIDALRSPVGPLDKAKAIREKKWRAAIGTGGDESEFPGTANAVVEGHDAGEYTLGDMGPKENVPSVDRRGKENGPLRQPAFSETRPIRTLHRLGALPAYAKVIEGLWRWPGKRHEP